VSEKKKKQNRLTEGARLPDRIGIGSSSQPDEKQSERESGKGMVAVLIGG
jgi:hypothetical protein